MGQGTIYLDNHATTRTDPRVVDAIIPPGAYDTDLERGWSSNANSSLFIYRNLGESLIQGIKKVVIKDRSGRTPGLLKFAVVGKLGSYPVATPPVHAVLVVDSPFATTGQCGEAFFPGPPPGPACTFTPGGTSLRCK